MTDLLAGFVLGLASSGHCAAMCGPLVLAARHQASGMREAVLYHAARIGMYAVFGALAGGLGLVASGGTTARVVSIAAGGLLVVMAAARLRGPRQAVRASTIGTAFGLGLAQIRRRASSRPAVAAVSAGALNACLPCGLLYAALVAALAIADPLRAAATMAFYGAGTTPALVTIWWMAGPIARLTRGRLTAIAPMVLALTGALLIGRGLLGPHTHTSAPGPVPAAQTPPHRH